MGDGCHGNTFPSIYAKVSKFWEIFWFTDFQRACKLKEGLSFGWSDTLKLQSQKVRIYYTLFLTWECHFLGEPVIFLSSTLIWGWCAVRLFAQKIWIENSENAHLWCCSWDSLHVSVLWGWRGVWMGVVHPVRSVRNNTVPRVTFWKISLK